MRGRGRHQHTVGPASDWLLCCTTVHCTLCCATAPCTLSARTLLKKRPVRLVRHWGVVAGSSLGLRSATGPPLARCAGAGSVTPRRTLCHNRERVPARCRLLGCPAAGGSMFSLVGRAGAQCIVREARVLGRALTRWSGVSVGRSPKQRPPFSHARTPVCSPVAARLYAVPTTDTPYRRRSDPAHTQQLPHRTGIAA